MKILRARLLELKQAEREEERAVLRVKDGQPQIAFMDENARDRLTVGGTPVPLGGLSSITQLACGHSFALALRADGRVLVRAVTNWNTVLLQLNTAHTSGVTALAFSARKCRIAAEDPYNGFMPSIGRVQEVYEPSGPGIRVEPNEALALVASD